MTATDSNSQLVFSGDGNPFKYLRKRFGYTQVQIADKAGISKHAVIRAEQGMAVSPSPTLINYYVRYFPVSRIELINQYERYQISMRTKETRILDYDEERNFVEQIYHYRFELQHYTNPTHPLVWLLGHCKLNPTSFAKALCINQTVVVHFINKPIAQQTVPDQILEALVENGYTVEELSYLKEAYKLFRETLIANSKIKLVSNG